MKRIIATLVMGLTSAAAFGELSWATVNTEKYTSDPAAGSADTTAYTAYLCTLDAAQEQFGASSVAGVTSYFQNNFMAGTFALTEATKGQTAETKFANGMAALDHVEWGGKGAGQYSFTGYVTPGSQSVAEYLGIVLYSSGGEDAVRVFSATSDGTKWIADDSTSRPSGTAGDWATAVPEPTSGLLLLLGVAGLALRRKRVVGSW